MQDEALNLLTRTMGNQRSRTDYPEGFPTLEEVPAARYFDPGFAKLEMDHMWMKTWLLAGLASEITEPGAYMLFEELDRSVIISRGKDGEIRAFHNVCRHRQSALLLEQKGRAMRFVCPYHAWGYALDGKLVSVPDQQDFACLDKSERGLLPVRCDVWRGMVFINFDENAEPLTDFLAPLVPQTAGYPLEKLVVKDRLVISMDCNWKAAYHNFLEIYHVATVHAKSIAPYLDSQSFVVAMFENGHGRFGTRKRKGDSIFKTELTMPDDIDNVYKECTIALPTFPNTFWALDPIGFTLQSFWPDGPDKSIMEARLVGWESDDQKDKDYWSAMRGNVEDILSEDLRLFASLQQGFKSGLLPSILMGYQERMLYWFEEEVDRRIGPDRIPPDMRVTPMLEGQITRV